MSYINNDSILNFKCARFIGANEAAHYQTATTTYTDMNGSLITYTPASSASKVVYKHVFHCSHISSGNFCGHFKLLVYDGSSWADSTKNRFTAGSATATDNNFQVTAVFVLDNWSGEKQLKMQFRRFSTGNDMYLNYPDAPNAGSSNDHSDNQIFYPQVFCYSVK